MESETQVENEVVIKAEELLVVDLNRATAEELRAVPGIGPTLAQRIITYRDTVHPFEEPIEITAVPGISEKTYRAIADHLTVAPTEILFPLEEIAEEEAVSQAEPPPEEEVAEKVYLPLDKVPLEEEVVLQAEAALPEEAPPEELAAEEEIAPEAEVAPPEPPSPAPAQIVPAPTLLAPRRGGLAWLWSALLGGLLGMVFTLLVLSGINGSLDIEHSQAVLKVNNQMSSLEAKMGSLQGEIGGLRQRLDTLEGLTTRMERTESAMDDLQGEMAALEQQTGALEDKVTTVSEDLAAIQSQTQQMETFFQRLQVLLNELFGEAEGTPVSTPTPTPSQ